MGNSDKSDSIVYRFYGKDQRSGGMTPFEIGPAVLSAFMFSMLTAIYRSSIRSWRCLKVVEIDFSKNNDM